MEILRKILQWFVLPVLIVLLGWLCVKSVMKPVKFNKEKEAREQVAIQRLKDIRELQNAFKSDNNRYLSTIDSVQWFYNEGKINVAMRLGSSNDSIADLNRTKLKARYRNLKGQAFEKELEKRYNAGERVWCEVLNPIPVKDTLCKRPDFCIDSLAFIPCCGDSVRMETILKTVSGVKVPLFEARMPYGEKDENGRIVEYMLRGMDHQLIVNLFFEKEDTDRYPGLMVGSITSPNNNAGNWE